MTPERLEALLWERIDGVISEDDRRELEDHLAADSDATRFAEEVADLNDRLAEAPMASPPEGLRGMEAVFSKVTVTRLIRNGQGGPRHGGKARVT